MSQNIEDGSRDEAAAARKALEAKKQKICHTLDQFLLATGMNELMEILPVSRRVLSDIPGKNPIVVMVRDTNSRTGEEIFRHAAKKNLETLQISLFEEGIQCRLAMPQSEQLEPYRLVIDIQQDIEPNTSALFERVKPEFDQKIRLGQKKVATEAAQQLGKAIRDMSPEEAKTQLQLTLRAIQMATREYGLTLHTSLLPAGRSRLPVKEKPTDLESIQLGIAGSVAAKPRNAIPRDAEGKIIDRELASSQLLEGLRAIHELAIGHGIELKALTRGGLSLGRGGSRQLRGPLQLRDQREQ